MNIVVSKKFKTTTKFQLILNSINKTSVDITTKFLKIDQIMEGFCLKIINFFLLNYIKISIFFGLSKTLLIQEYIFKRTET